MAEPAVFDTSFWINADRAEFLPLVLARFALFYPPIVAEEMVESFDSGQAFRRELQAGRLHRVAPAVETIKEPGVGERATLNVALEHPGWWALVDDRAALPYAAAAGIPTMTTPAFVIALYVDGTLDARESLSALARLAALQTVSPHLLARALIGLAAKLKEG